MSELRVGTPVRTLPNVLRRALTPGQESARVLLGTVVSAPDNAHVRIDIGGAQSTIPKLAQYSAPVAGEPCYVLVSGAFTIALGSVRR
jgi:hypothetical protein